MNKDLRIVFLGTPDFAVANLKALVDDGQNIVGVITAPDKPAGRGKKIQQSAVKKYATEQNLNILQPSNLKDEDFIHELKSLKADLNIVVAFRMLPEMVWNMPELGTFNLHASLLPQYRGAAPINWAIMNGETETGVSTFFLKHEIDTGNIIQQEKVSITPDMNVEVLHDTLMNLGAELVVKTVHNLVDGNIESTPQADIAEDNLKPAPKIFKPTCRIDWSRTGVDIHNHIRGLSPYPAAWSKLNGKSLKVFKGQFEKAKHQQEFKSLISDQKTFLKVAIQDGYYLLEEIQIEGKKRIKIEDFLRGYQLELKNIDE